MMGADSEDEMQGFKRVRVVDDEQASVQVIFKSLSRKSKKKLEELLHHWSEWHANECSSPEGSDVDLESGEETYFPALHVGTDKSCTIIFNMDNQMKKKQKTGDVSFNKDGVPTYDRSLAFALTSGDGSTNKESVVDILNASRCFNCDSYDHLLKDCPKPFNKVVVDNAHKLHQLKSRRPTGPRVLTRYYQNTPGGKFDGLMPGCLDAETRKLLGLRESDPPPWLDRMRELGYPPGYLDIEAKDQPSGIIIHTNDDTKEENKELFNIKSTDPKRKMSVAFPGINAPIPSNADKRRWADPMSQPTRVNNNPLNQRLEGNNPRLYSRNHSHNPSRWPDCRQESSHFMSDYAPRPPPLLSSYANKYWDYINQTRPSYHSSYEYQNSWCSWFHR